MPRLFLIGIKLALGDSSPMFESPCLPLSHCKELKDLGAWEKLNIQ